MAKGEEADVFHGGGLVLAIPKLIASPMSAISGSNKKNKKSLLPPSHSKSLYVHCDHSAFTTLGGDGAT
jgi:hypothetical protein